MHYLKPLTLFSLIVATSAFAAPSASVNAGIVQSELALREECVALSTKLVIGFKKARGGDTAPVDPIEAAGYELPEATDIAAQAYRLKRECIKDSAGATAPTWAAVEVSAQAKALMTAAFRCVLKGVSFAKPVHEAELEQAGCYTPEYAGLPSRLGGHFWSLATASGPNGTVLEAQARISGDDAATVCTLLNEYKVATSPVSCQVRDNYSIVRAVLPLTDSNVDQEALAQAMRQMVEDYKKSMPSSPEASASSATAQ